MVGLVGVGGGGMSGVGMGMGVDREGGGGVVVGEFLKDTAPGRLDGENSYGIHVLGR